MLIEDRGLVYDATRQPKERRAAAFCDVTRLDDGALVCAFQVGPQKNDATSTVHLCRSDDGGRTWRDLPSRPETRFGGVPGSLAAGVVAQAAPGRWVLAATWFDRTEPERPLFDPETQGILHSKLLRAFSSDGGESWTAWDEVPVPGLSGYSLTGPMLRWPDGTLGLALESYKEFDDPRPASHAAWLLVSRDAAASFPERYLVAQHPEHCVYYWDQRLCVGPGDGPDARGPEDVIPATDVFAAKRGLSPSRRPTPFKTLAALFWTHDLREQRDLNVHLRRTALGDDGLVASPIRATTIAGQIAAPLWLADGRLVALVVARDTPGTITLWQSFDGGETWPEDHAVVVYTHDERALLSQGRDGIDYNAYWEDMAKWSFGHPALCRLEGDRILAIHYAGPPNEMSIHWAQIDTSR
jgi:hypothetical protein